MAASRIPGSLVSGRSTTIGGETVWIPTAAGDPNASAVAVVPHDVNALATGVRALYVGVAGDITMRGVDDTADTLWKNVPAGTCLRFCAAYVRATGTTATNILALL